MRTCSPVANESPYTINGNLYLNWTMVLQPVDLQRSLKFHSCAPTLTQDVYTLYTVGSTYIVHTLDVKSAFGAFGSFVACSVPGDYLLKYGFCKKLLR